MSKYWAVFNKEDNRITTAFGNAIIRETKERAEEWIEEEVKPQYKTEYEAREIEFVGDQDKGGLVMEKRKWVLEQIREGKKLKKELNKKVKEVEECLYKSFGDPYFGAVNSQMINITEVSWELKGKMITIFADAYVSQNFKDKKRKEFASAVLSTLKLFADEWHKKDGEVRIYVHGYGVYGATKQYPKGEWDK